MCISDWSSDVCASDLEDPRVGLRHAAVAGADVVGEVRVEADALQVGVAVGQADQWPACADQFERGQAVRVQLPAVARGEVDFQQRLDRRDDDAAGGERLLPGDGKSVVEGKRVSVRVALGGRRSVKKKRIESLRNITICQEE